MGDRMRTWWHGRAERAAMRQAIEDNGGACECGYYKASSAIKRHHEGDDLTLASSWMPVCGYCRAELESERRALRRSGFLWAVE